MRDNSLYRKVYGEILTDIRSGRVKNGDRLPTEGELSGRYGVSLITVKKALSLLSEEGYVQRVPGKGSFITEATGRKDNTEQKNPGTLPLIGLVFEHATTPFGLETIYTLDKLAAESGYKLVIGFSYGDREKETREIQTLIATGVKGIIIMPSHGKYYSTDILRLVVENYPVVLIDKQLEGIPVSSVCTDNGNAAAMLVRHLHEAGRKRIGMISTANLGTSSVEERREGFFAQLRELSLESGPECRPDIRRFDLSIDDTPYETIHDYLRDNIHLLDAVFCSEYGFVPHLAKAAAELDIAIPGNLAVCCVDEDYLAPGGFFFTHARQDEAAIAERAMGLMLDMLDGKKETARRYDIPAIFRQGRST